MAEVSALGYNALRSPCHKNANAANTAINAPIAVAIADIHADLR